MAYNEEQNIAQALRALISQTLTTVTIREIIVVASGCTDRTVEIAERFAARCPLVRVEVQATRAGKAAAIQHLLRLCQTEVVVLAGADGLADPAAIEHLVAPFGDPTVGMTGPRVVPLNDPRSLLGFTVQMLWQVHHRMALRWPKLGELVAFRNVANVQPELTAADEVSLEALLSQKGYRLMYVPQALVYILGPETMADFLGQRRRIFAGHLHVAAVQKYVAASLPFGHLWVLVWESASRDPELVPLMTAAILIECWGRLLGYLDYSRGVRHQIWRQIATTKSLKLRGRSLTLASVQCAPGLVKPAFLMRQIKRLPASLGMIFWWDHRADQLMMLLPPEVPADRIEASVSALMQRIAPSPAVVVSYRAIAFDGTQSWAGRILPCASL